jgi:hypothetical protein
MGGHIGTSSSPYWWVHLEIGADIQGFRGAAQGVFGNERPVNGGVRAGSSRVGECLGINPAGSKPAFEENKT